MARETRQLQLPLSSEQQEALAREYPTGKSAPRPKGGVSGRGEFVKLWLRGGADGGAQRHSLQPPPPLARPSPFAPILHPATCATEQCSTSCCAMSAQSRGAPPANRRCVELPSTPNPAGSPLQPARRPSPLQCLHGRVHDAAMWASGYIAAQGHCGM